MDATAVWAVSSLLRTSTKAAVAAEGACWTIVVLLGSGGIVAASCRTIAMLSRGVVTLDTILIEIGMVLAPPPGGPFLPRFEPGNFLPCFAARTAASLIS